MNVMLPWPVPRPTTVLGRRCDLAYFVWSMMRDGDFPPVELKESRHNPPGLLIIQDHTRPRTIPGGIGWPPLTTPSVAVCRLYGTDPKETP